MFAFQTPFARKSVLLCSRLICPEPSHGMSLFMKLASLPVDFSCCYLHNDFRPEKCKTEHKRILNSAFTRCEITVVTPHQRKCQLIFVDWICLPPNSTIGSRLVKATRVHFTFECACMLIKISFRIMQWRHGFETQSSGTARETHATEKLKFRSFFSELVKENCLLWKQWPLLE